MPRQFGITTSKALKLGKLLLFIHISDGDCRVFYIYIYIYLKNTHTHTRCVIFQFFVTRLKVLVVVGLFCKYGAGSQFCQFEKLVLWINTGNFYNLLFFFFSIPTRVLDL